MSLTCCLRLLTSSDDQVWRQQWTGRSVKAESLRWSCVLLQISLVLRFVSVDLQLRHIGMAERQRLVRCCHCVGEWGTLTTPSGTAIQKCCETQKWPAKSFANLTLRFLLLCQSIEAAWNEIEMFWCCLKFTNWTNEKISELLSSVTWRWAVLVPRCLSDCSWLWVYTAALLAASNPRNPFWKLAVKFDVRMHEKKKQINV